MSDQRERLPDWTRRNVLVTSGVLGASALAGCSSGGGEGTPTGTPEWYELPEEDEGLDDTPEIVEEWTADSLDSTNDPQWDSRDPYNMEISIDDTADELRLDASGEDSVRISTPFDYQGWTGRWKLSGTFTLESLSGTVRHEVRVHDGERDRKIKLSLVDAGNLDDSLGAGDTHTFDFTLSGARIDSSGVTSVSFELGETYKYELRHTGDGNYDATIGLEAEFDSEADVEDSSNIWSVDADGGDYGSLFGQHGPEYYFDTTDAAVVTHDRIEYNGNDTDEAIETWTFSQETVHSDSNNHTDTIYGHGQGMSVMYLSSDEDYMANDDAATRYDMQVVSSFTAMRGNKDGSSLRDNYDASDLTGPDNTISWHQIFVSIKDNEDGIEMLSGSGEHYIGFHPAEGTETELEDHLLQEGVKFALGTIPYYVGPTIGILFAAGTIYEELSEGDNPAAPGDIHFVQDTSGNGDEQQPETNMCRFDVNVRDSADHADITIRDVIEANYTYGAVTFGTEADFRLHSEGEGIEKLEERRIFYTRVESELADYAD